MIPLVHKCVFAVAVPILFNGFGVASAQLLPAARYSICSDSPFDKAEKIRQQPEATPEDLRRAGFLYWEALQCNPEPDLQARILLDMGRVQLSLQENAEALKSLSSAIDVFKQIDNPSKDTLTDYAASFLNKALALRRLSHIDEALGAYGEGRILFHTIGDQSGEARALGDLGHMNFLIGDYLAAEQYYADALALTGHDERQEVVIKAFLGRIYARMNESEMAMDSLQSALALARRTGYWCFIAYTLNDIGALLFKQKKLVAAERNHEEALELLKKHDPANGPGIAETQAYLGDVQTALGKYDLAIRNYREALASQEQSGDIIGQAQTLFSLAMTKLATNQVEEALQSLQQASELYHKGYQRLGESNARFQMAKIHASQKNYKAAQDEVSAAIDLAEKVRITISGSRLRTSYFSTLEEMYKFQVDLLLEQPQVSLANQFLAFQLLERAHSRTLLDAWESKRVGDNFFFCDTSALQRREILLNLAKENRKLEFLLEDRSRSATIQEAFVGIKRLEAALDRLEMQCLAEQPRLGVLSNSTTSIPDIQHDILDENTTLVRFYLSNPNSYAWVITKSKVAVVHLAAKKSLEPLVEALRFSEVGDWTTDQKAALKRLYGYLVPVFTSTRSKRWIVIPDGALYYFPFSLLQLEQTNGIERTSGTEFVKIPSAAAIHSIRQTPSQKTAWTLAVFADPVFDVRDSRVTVSHNRAQTTARQLPATAQFNHASAEPFYGRLIYSGREAELIFKAVPKSQRISFRGFDARLEAATGDALIKFKIIHIASHAGIDNRHPDLSHIVLSRVTEGGRPRPGLLLQKDIYRMRLNADLVVLSLCRSALGVPDPGEGLMSLSRAFLFAGSKSVLASLWEVDDEATAEFMGSFYRHMLQEKNSPSRALVMTQVEFRHHRVEKFRNPYYWAAFELYGDWLIK
jgi:tetratricopeptide (TPR) repeat protein